MDSPAVSSYDFNIYPGPEGTGTYLFTLFVDDTTS